MVRSKAASEFGGKPGRIQRPPHDVATDPKEQLRLLHQTETADPLSPLASPEGVLAAEWAMEGRSSEVPE